MGQFIIHLLNITNDVNLLVICFTAIIGLIFGSFSTFVGFRLFNKHASLLSKRSMCCKCKHKLQFLDLIPFFSFLLLKGRCRYCRSTIPLWHLIAEIIMPILFILSVILFNGINAESMLLCIILWCLITQSIIDIRVMMSSDTIHIIVMFASIILSTLLGNSINEIIIKTSSVVIFFLLLIYIMKQKFHKETLGFGDVKLFISLSPLLNLNQFVAFIGLTGFFGILSFLIIKSKTNKTQNEVNNQNLQYPFIPSISLSFTIIFFIYLFKLGNGS